MNLRLRLLARNPTPSLESMVDSLEQLLREVECLNDKQLLKRFESLVHRLGLVLAMSYQLQASGSSRGELEAALNLWIKASQDSFKEFFHDLKKRRRRALVRSALGKLRLL